MDDGKKGNNINKSGELIPPKRPPVDIKDEAVVVAEFRRLKRKVNKLLKELRIARHSQNVFQKLFFEATEYEEIRNLVLSFANEYAIRKNEHDDIAHAKKIDRE